MSSRLRPGAALACFLAGFFFSRFGAFLFPISTACHSSRVVASTRKFKLHHYPMPTTLAEEDQSRLESLCMLFGVGLVLFDLSKDNPRFSIRVRAQRFLPDMFYVNEFADRLEHYDIRTFEELFGYIEFVCRDEKSFFFTTIETLTNTLNP
jgi:hypothetical protein